MIEQCLDSIILLIEGIIKVKALNKAQLEKILRLANETFAPALTAEVAQSVWALNFSLFSTVMGISVFFGDMSNKHLTLCFGIANAIWTVFIVTNVMKLVRRCEKISKTIKSFNINLSGDDKIEFDGFRPYNAFDMSYSNALSIFGWIITNMIVLVQFRSAEDVSI